MLILEQVEICRLIKNRLSNKESFFEIQIPNILKMFEYKNIYVDIKTWDMHYILPSGIDDDNDSWNLELLHDYWYSTPHGNPNNTIIIKLCNFSFFGISNQFIMMVT